VRGWHRPCWLSNHHACFCRVTVLPVCLSICQPATRSSCPATSCGNGTTLASLGAPWASGLSVSLPRFQSVHLHHVFKRSYLVLSILCCWSVFQHAEKRRSPVHHHSTLVSFLVRAGSWTACLSIYLAFRPPTCIIRITSASLDSLRMSCHP
jgi:hypothetical protein